MIKTLALKATWHWMQAVINHAPIPVVKLLLPSFIRLTFAMNDLGGWRATGWEVK